MHAQRLAGYEERIANAEQAAADERDPYLLATLDFRLTYERAVLDWFDQLTPTVGEISRPKQEAPRGARVADTRRRLTFNFIGGLEIWE